MNFIHLTVHLPHNWNVNICVQKYAHFCSEWCIEGYRTSALWDLWIWPILITGSTFKIVNSHGKLSNFVTNIVFVGVLAPLGASSSTVRVMAVFESKICTGLTTQNQISENEIKTKFSKQVTFWHWATSSKPRHPQVNQKPVTKVPMPHVAHGVVVSNLTFVTSRKTSFLSALFHS